MTFRCAYFSPTLEEVGWLDEPRLAAASERHKIPLARPQLAAVRGDALSSAEGANGIVLEMWLGWPALRHLRLASRALRRALRVWAYWPNEEAIECVDADWLRSGWRHWFLASCYFTVVPKMRALAAAAREPNSIARRLMGGKTPGEWRLAIRCRTLIAALRERAKPVFFATPLPPAADARLPGTGIYLRLDFWTRIQSGGSYGHTCYVAKELAATTEAFQCFIAHRFALLDTFGVPQREVPPPSEIASENVIVDVSLYYYQKLRGEIEGLKPAYIYERLVLGNYAGAMLSQALQVPYIVEYNGSEISMRRSFDGTGYVHEDVYERAEMLAFEQATAVNVISAEVKAALVARGVSESKILVNPNGADLTDYAPARPEEKSRLRNELGLRDGDRIVGFSGTFGGWHGVDVLADAIPPICAQAPRTKFLLIGDGHYKHLVDTAVRDHHLEDRVISTGRVPQAEGARLLKACDIYVSPHNRHMVDSKFFGSPTKLFEYMAMGGGIVASDLEQIGEVLQPALRPSAFASGDIVVGGERAVVCAPGSVDEFVQAVLGLVERPDVCVALGRNARQAVADHYSWTQHVAHLWKFVATMTPAPPAAERRRIGADYRRELRAKALHVTPAETNAPLPVAQVVAQPTGDPYKDEVQRQWDSDPAGAHYVRSAPPHTVDWFLEAERYRYQQYAPWMAETMEFGAHAGESVLEIGGGMGTDLAQFAAHGATVTDLDLSAGHLNLAKENFGLRGLNGRFVLHDAETLPFPDDSFDLVYSNGVLHHTPNTREVVREILRVLKPGGRAIVMMYAENSLHYWRNVFYTVGLRDGELLQWSAGDIMSRIIERSDNAAARPLVKVYTKPRLARLFQDFSDVSIVQRQMVHDEVPEILSCVPVRYLGPLLGWNLVIKARKPLR
jgi:glycosyltransferase involved in cell wall biosynthesis/ubiquinone/menaquinone biosynthesis C-methylase UbiE